MDKLTDEELVELKVLFDSIDNDNDDLISKEDLSKLYEENGFEISLDDIQEFINDYKDHKECINFPAFVYIITDRINSFNNKIDRRVVTNFDRDLFRKNASTGRLCGCTHYNRGSCQCIAAL